MILNMTITTMSIHYNDVCTRVGEYVDKLLSAPRRHIRVLLGQAFRRGGERIRVLSDRIVRLN